MRFSHCIFLVSVSLFAIACERSESTQDPSSPAHTADAPEQASAADLLPALQEVVRKDSCSFNAPAPDARVITGKPLPVWGYAFDPDSALVPADVWVRLTPLSGGQAISIRAKRGAREDVAAALRRPELLNSGFGAEIDLQGLPPGKYSVAVLQRVDGKYLLCESPAPIVLS